LRAAVAARKPGLQEQRRVAEEMRSEGRWGELLLREGERAGGKKGRPAASRRTRGVLVEVAGQVKDDAGQGRLDLGTSLLA
jgi:hypothetical protein